MIGHEDLLSGMAYYQKHQYISALKQFSKCANRDNNQISQMIFESLEAITNMQLCNYNQAAEQLNQLRVRLSHWEKHSGGREKGGEVEVLKVKVLANLLIIYLVNCSNDADNVLEELVGVVEDRYNRNKTAGLALFRAVLKSLFGFESFNQLQSQVLIALAKVQRQENPKSKLNKGSIQQIPSPILLTSLSIYSHLTGNTAEAIRLEREAYKATKDNNTIAAALSLRHLQELHREAGNEKQRKYFHQELMVLMSNEQLEGIAEETLFRNYSLKIQSAHRIVAKLAKKQKEMIEQQWDDSTRLAVLWKLKTMRNGVNSQNINTVIQLLKNDSTVLQIMGDGQFIQQALTQYRKNISQLVETVNRYKLSLYGEMIKKLSQFAVVKPSRLQKQSRIININFMKAEEKAQENVNQEKQSSEQKKRQFTPNRGQKRQHASSLYLQQKKITNFKSQLAPKEQQQQKNSSLTSSRLSVRGNNNSKVHQKNQVYLHQAQKQKVVYKIGREDQKKGQKNERGRQVNKERVVSEGPERSKSRDLVEFKQKNAINQFIRPQQVISQSKLRQQGITLPVKDIKIEQREQVQDSQTHPIKNNDGGQNPLGQLNKPTMINNPSQLSQVSQPSERLFPHPLPPRIQIVQQPPYTSFIPLGTTKFIEHKQSLKYQDQQRLQTKIRKSISLCVAGQYIEKRHFSSDGGAQRFLKLSQHKDKLYWGPDQQLFDQSEYSIQDIKGIVFGKITQTMMKDANKKLQPWKCFSLIMKKRTFDVYCHEERDLKFWIPGLSVFLKEFNYQNEKYSLKKISQSKIEKKSHNIVLGDKVITRYYSVGRVLWKRFLMRMQSLYIKTKKKDRKNDFFCANAFAIVVGAVRSCGYKPEKLKRALN